MVEGQFVAHLGNIKEYRVNIVRGEYVLWPYPRFRYAFGEALYPCRSCERGPSHDGLQGDIPHWINGVVMSVVWKLVGKREGFLLLAGLCGERLGRSGSP